MLAHMSSRYSRTLPSNKIGGGAAVHRLCACVAGVERSKGRVEEEGGKLGDWEERKMHFGPFLFKFIIII